MKMPAAISNFLVERREGIESPCAECNSNCCNGPGFAILENILEIFEVYKSGKLTRSDYELKKGLSLSQFIFFYFDRTVFNNLLMLFFPKMIGDYGRLISVPPWEFWKSRDYIKKRERSYGCIFLNKKQVIGDNSPNFCILHSEIQDQITHKPIDCIFLSCQEIKKVKEPTINQSNFWFALLNYHFPNSIERFKQLCPDLAD